MGIQHTSVMVREVLEALDLPRRHCVVDATLGLGGHCLAMLEESPFKGTVVGIDRDESHLLEARKRMASFAERTRFFHSPFSSLRELAEQNGLRFDGILFDLGVASSHFDLPERGFSYTADGPLDMRMDPSGGLSAGDFLSTAPQEELTSCFRDYGEEPLARFIAEAIVHNRCMKPITRTLQLAEMVADVYRRRFRSRSRKHCATRVFQALRIQVNHELEELRTALFDAVDLLEPGGRIVVISYHSLEDRIVKRFFRAAAGRPLEGEEGAWIFEKSVLRLIAKRPIVPGQEEIAANRRARSAKMRVAEKRADSHQLLVGSG